MFSAFVPLSSVLNFREESSSLHLFICFFNFNVVFFLKASHFQSRVLARYSHTLIILSYLLAGNRHSHISWCAGYLDHLLVWKIPLISLIFLGPCCIKPFRVRYFFPVSLYCIWFDGSEIYYKHRNVFYKKACSIPELTKLF